jgi:hypothetical protein
VKRKRQHDWECIANSEKGYYFWRCRNVGCSESMPYPSGDKEFPKGPCTGRNEKKSPPAWMLK